MSNDRRVRFGIQTPQEGASFAALAEQLDLQDGSLHQVDDVTALAIGPRPSILAQAA